MGKSLDHDTAKESGSLVFESRRRLVSVQTFARARWAELASAALLGVMAFQMLAVISRKSITVDEIVMIPAAYYHAVDLELFIEHPPLVKTIAGAALILLQPFEAGPERVTGAPGSQAQQWSYAEVFWQDNTNIFESLSFWPRLMMILFTLALGMVIFIFARQLFGPLAAVLAVALFTLEPTVLAHGRVVQTDIAATFGYVLVFFTLYHYAKGPSYRRAAWVGTAAGLALLAKFSMLLTVPVLAGFLCLALWRIANTGKSRRKLLGHAALIALTAVLIINAGYFFRHRSLQTADFETIQETFPSSSLSVARATGVLSWLLPTDFILGLSWPIRHDREGHPAGLLGMHRRTGWWYYFPVAFVLKTSLPFLLLSLSALAWGVREWLVKRELRFLWLLTPFAIYTLFVLADRIDIGVRYFLPAYPFLFILSGALIERLFRSGKARRARMFLAVAILGWMAIEAVRAFPNQMSYMNQLASARPHWWYLSDSNVEWGDDARALALYLRARGETSVRSAFLGDFFTLQHYGIQSINLTPADGSEPAPSRFTAIGASFLNGSTVPEQLMVNGHQVSETERLNFFDAYRRRAPEAVFGGSIYLYREGEQK